MNAEHREGERNEQPSIVVSRGSGRHGFFSIEEAFSFIKEREDCWHSVAIKLEIPRLSVVVEGDFGPDNSQTVIIEALKKRAAFPRSIIPDYGFSVSADPLYPGRPVPCDTINVHVGDYDTDPDLERGLAWVDVRNPSNPTIDFNLKPHPYDDERLQEVFGRVFGRVMQVLTSALEGIIPPPSY